MRPPVGGLNGVYSARIRGCEGLTCDGRLAAVAPSVEPSPRTQPTPGVQTHYPMSREVRADDRLGGFKARSNHPEPDSVAKNL